MFIVFGYSQSALVASLVKQDLIDGNCADGPGTAEIRSSWPRTRCVRMAAFWRSVSRA